MQCCSCFDRTCFDGSLLRQIRISTCPYFYGGQTAKGGSPTKIEILRKEVAMLEVELKTKTELVKKQETLIQECRAMLKGQLDKLNNELERVRSRNNVSLRKHGQMK
ncbi:hypothetical protein MLD38_040377 [Melastoma candidum]|uniref:Uncharacterized protein n=1 Tax=Melastoma candidum TaxID=119954 RepID=A0ACB9L5T3_9MYRT|nr:hypothetical protein MLD38_040377 [Melastoma candidum]